MARKISPDAQEAIATARFIRVSPTKMRQVVDLIRGLSVEEARQLLRFSTRAVSTPVGKVLDSAIANAENNRGLPSDELVVARAWVDEGPTLRRFRPRALGRATRIRKRTCHVSVVVGRVEDESSRRPAGGRRRARRGREDASSTRSRRSTGSTKSTAKKTSRKKTTAKKSTAKKTTAKKTAKKTTAKKTARKSTRKKETDE